MTTAIKTKSVRRVVVLQADASGGYTPVTVYRKNSKRKKISRSRRPIEKAVRRIAKAAGIAASSYSERHQRSNEKKRNGWSKDFSKNMRRANRKGRKDAKVKKLRPF